MGIGPAPATQKLLDRHKLKIVGHRCDRVERGVCRAGARSHAATGLPDDAAHVNPNGGAIALGHPLGASGARLVLTAARQLKQTGGRYAMATMCIGVGQGIALLVEKV